MVSNRIYYALKPYLPWYLRLTVRRRVASRQRAMSKDTWPVKESAGHAPRGWQGWPDGKRFAFVLTHDVEGPIGLSKTQTLADLEKSVGFKSCFNFIPAGSYRVTRELRDYLVRLGFEVGVHDLYHDGKLYHSREKFAEHAEEINRYLSDWGAVGFRSGFMLRNLDWIQSLNLAYDTSTFDTDPFEPQPDGVDTIFPYWVAGANGAGYAELPYTLPQDSTLFLVLQENTIDIWKKKLDWIVARGGMALVNVHPDYVDFQGENLTNATYPAALYRQLLEYVKEKYAGQFWNALPREVAGLVKDQKSKTAVHFSANGNGATVRRKGKIWIDLDNTPHVPFFEPIMEELKARGYEVLVTARDAFQVCDLADKKGMSYIKVGRHHGKNRAMKAIGLLYRAMQLAPAVMKEKPALGVSHGSRSQLLLNNWMQKPTILIEDYEHCQFPIMMKPTWIMAPDVIPTEVLPCKNVRQYSGIKEDVYAWKLAPEKDFLQKLGIEDSALVITVRPPATEAHYHNPESEKLFEKFMDRAAAAPGVRIVLLPRNQKQGAFIRETWPAWFANNKTVIPKGALDGLNLIWHSDLVVSGGGTMNREAAALDVPVYSIFRGTIGAVDRQLSKEGRLVLIESLADVDSKIRLEKRRRRPVGEVTSKRTLMQIVDSIEEIAQRVNGN